GDDPAPCSEASPSAVGVCRLLLEFHFRRIREDPLRALGFEADVRSELGANDALCRPARCTLKLDNHSVLGDFLYALSATLERKPLRGDETIDLSHELGKPVSRDTRWLLCAAKTNGDVTGRLDRPAPHGRCREQQA